MDEIYAYARSSDHVTTVHVSEAWKRPKMESKMAQLEEFQQSNSYRELFGIDGEPIEFEWNIFPGLTSLEILQKIQKDLQNQNIEPENFEGRIIFMSMFNDIDWTKRGNSEKCIRIRTSYAKRFSRGLWTPPGPGDEKKWYGTLSYTPEGKWDSIAAEMVGHFKKKKKPVTQYSRASVL